MSENPTMYSTAKQKEIDRNKALQEKYLILLENYINQIVDEVETFGNQVGMEEITSWNQEVVDALAGVFAEKTGIEKITTQVKFASHIIKLQGFSARYKFIREKMSSSTELTEEDLTEIHKIINA